MGPQRLTRRGAIVAGEVEAGGDIVHAGRGGQLNWAQRDLVDLVGRCP